MSKGTIPAYVLGVGLTQFLKPRRTREYPELGFEAGAKAMIDAKITFDDVETGVACELCCSDAPGLCY
jgi:sterol carrier protein 2